MFNRLVAVLLSAAASIAVFNLVACSASQPNLPPTSKENAGPSVLVKSYKMSVGDQIQINVWKNPELSLSEPIRPDGKVSVPLVGDVMAVGLTPEELARKIEVKLPANHLKSIGISLPGKIWALFCYITNDHGCNELSLY